MSLVWVCLRQFLAFQQRSNDPDQALFKMLLPKRFMIILMYSVHNENHGRVPGIYNEHKNLDESYENRVTTTVYKERSERICVISLIVSPSLISDVARRVSF